MEIRFAAEIEYIKKKHNAKTPFDYETLIIENTVNTPWVFNGFVLPFAGQKTKVSFTCQKHNKTHLIPLASYCARGCFSGCPICSVESRIELTRRKDEEVISAILDKCKRLNKRFDGFEGGEYKNNNTKIFLYCYEHKQVESVSVRSFVHDDTCQGCKKCAMDLVRKSRLIPEEEATQDVIKICNDRGFIFNGWYDGYKNNNSRLILTCKEHGVTWNDTCYRNFKHQESGCPKCNRTGYKNDKPGYLYVQKITGAVDALKFGICNKTPEYRMKTQSEKSIVDHELIFSYRFDDGYHAFKIEQEIKRRYSDKRRFVTKEIMPDGYTETLPADLLPNFLKEVKNLCNEVRFS